MKAGNSIFMRVKNWKKDEEILLNGKEIIYIKGCNFGDNWEDYINVYI